MAKHTYSVAEAAHTVGISTPAMYAAIRRGEIPHLRIRRRIVVPKVALLRLLGEVPVATDPTTEETQ